MYKNGVISCAPYAEYIPAEEVMERYVNDGEQELGVVINALLNFEDSPRPPEN